MISIITNFIDENKFIIFLAFVISLALQCLYTIYLYFKYDKEYGYKAPEPTSELPSQDNIEIVSCLVNQKFNYYAFVAYFLHFFDLKVMVIEEFVRVSENTSSIRIVINEFEQMNLAQEDQVFLTELTKNYGYQINLEDFSNKEKLNDFFNIYNAFEKRTIQRMQLIKDFESIKPNYVLIFLLNLLGIVASYLYKTYNPIAWVGIVLSILFGIYPYTIHKMTKDGRDKYLKWKSYRNYLLSLKPLEFEQWPNCEEWFKLLSYSYALGIGDEMLHTMMNKKPIDLGVMDNHNDYFYAEFEHLTKFVVKINNVLASKGK